MDAVRDKDILVSPDTCSQQCDCAREECALCRPCLSPRDLRVLKAAWSERRNQGSTWRIFPPPVASRATDHLQDAALDNISPSNKKLIRWYQEKCKMDRSWCDV